VRAVRWRERSRVVRAVRLWRTRNPCTFREKVRYKMLRAGDDPGGRAPRGRYRLRARRSLRHRRPGRVRWADQLSGRGVTACSIPRRSTRSSADRGPCRGGTGDRRTGAGERGLVPSGPPWSVWRLAPW